MTSPSIPSKEGAAKEEAGDSVSRTKAAHSGENSEKVAPDSSTTITTTSLGGMAEETDHDSNNDDFVTPPIYYFGFGAMVNETSRKRRHVKSRFEQPAILHDYKLLFVIPGAATVTPCQGEQVHGVLMELTPSSWNKTLGFEKGYSVVQEEVHPYKVNDGGTAQSPIVARLFRLDERVEDKLGRPEERYIKIISQGMRQYGVDESYIQKTIIEESNFVPSLGPKDFRKCHQISPSLPDVTWEEYQAQCQEQWCFVLDNRIFQLDKNQNRHDKDHPSHLILQWMEHNAFGQATATWKIWNTLVDPDMPECACEQELTDLHHAWAEHKLVEAFTKTKVVLPIVTARLVPTTVPKEQ